MAPFNNYTTKAKEAIHRAHQLAVERGHNQVSTLHLLAALLLQEETMVLPMLEQIEVDVAHLTDSVLEMIEGSGSNTAVSPSFQLYLTPELVRVFEAAPRIAASAVSQHVEIFVLLEDVLDFESESRRLEKELTKMEREFGFTQKKLSNEDYLQKAPASVIESEREKGARLREKLEKLRHQYEKIKILKQSAAVRK